MKKLIYVSLIAIGMTVALSACHQRVSEAAEQLDLTIPVPAPIAQVDSYKVGKLTLDRMNNIIEVIVWDGSDRNTMKTFEFTGQDAIDNMVALNKADLTSNSLEKRILNKLISDGFLAGSVSGTPD